MNKLSCCFVAAIAASVSVFCHAFEIGDRIEFAADGYLRSVTLAGRSGERAYYGSLDGYGDIANATAVETLDGLRLDIDDWRNSRNIKVVKNSSGTDVSFAGKVRRKRTSCEVKTPAAVAQLRTAEKRVGETTRASDNLTSGWPKDPVENEVDILVVFDKTAIAYLEDKGETPVEAAEAQIAKMNAALANSGLAGDFKVKLASTYNADFDIVKDFSYEDYPTIGDLGAALDAMDNNPNEEPWKSILAKREAYGADIIMTLVDQCPGAKLDEISGTVGMAFALENDEQKRLTAPVLKVYREGAFGFCNIKCCEYDHTFAHEAGHIMGAGHSEILDPDYAVPGPQLFEYSSALMYLDEQDSAYYYTIMGYNSVDNEIDSPIYEEIPYYSSPNLYHPMTGTALGDEKHDNARTLRETYKYIAQYRVRKDPKATVGPQWSKSRTLLGSATRALPEPFNIQGIFELKLGKANKKTGKAKISATLTRLDGAKIKFAAQTINVAGEEVKVVWGDFSLTITGDKFYGGYNRDGAISVQSDLVGGLMNGSAKAYILGIDEFAPGGRVIEDLLPTDMKPEKFSFAGKSWNFPKAAKVKISYDKKTNIYSLNIDTSKGCTNLSAMKLSYSSKKATFKGSFTVYSRLTSTKGKESLKKFTVKTTGVVVDGEGAGIAYSTKPKDGPWTIGVSSDR